MLFHFCCFLAVFYYYRQQDKQFKRPKVGASFTPFRSLNERYSVFQKICTSQNIVQRRIAKCWYCCGVTEFECIKITW